MPAASAGPLVSVDLALRPEAFVAAWRADTRRLLLEASESPRVQQRLAVRITLEGLGVAATITGRVVTVSPRGGVHRFELVPDDARVRAVEKLVAVARGEAVDYRPRAPRFLATMPVVVQGTQGPTYMTTFSVSAEGCALAWSGPAPAVGAPLDVRLGAGNRPASLRGVVCWSAQTRGTVTVGVRFVAGANATWRSIVRDVEHSGALPG